MAQCLRAHTVLAEGPEFASQDPQPSVTPGSKDSKPLWASSGSWTHVYIPIRIHKNALLKNKQVKESKREVIEEVACSY